MSAATLHSVRGANAHLQQQARRAYRKAIRRGELVSEPCEVCGDTRTDGHHDDYAQPLVVRWLCRFHHRSWHDGHLIESATGELVWSWGKAA